MPLHIVAAVQQCISIREGHSCTWFIKQRLLQSNLLATEEKKKVKYLFSSIEAMHSRLEAEYVCATALLNGTFGKRNSLEPK